MKIQRGWGLVEILLVVTLVGTGMALGLPTVADVLERSRLVSAAADLEHAARMARSEALKRNTTVMFTAGPGFWQVSVDSSGITEILHAGGLDARVSLDSGAINFRAMDSPVRWVHNSAWISFWASTPQTVPQRNDAADCRSMRAAWPGSAIRSRDRTSGERVHESDGSADTPITLCSRITGRSATVQSRVWKAS